MRVNVLVVLLALALALLAGGCLGDNPIVVIRTGLGDVEVETYQEEAPLTAGNFLKYVEWPANGGGPYRVVVVGASDVTESLSRIAASRFAGDGGPGSTTRAASARATRGSG